MGPEAREAQEAADRGGGSEVEARYRALVEAAPDGIVVHHEGIILYANSAAARIFGARRPEELVGRKVLEFVHPADHALVVDRIQRIEKGGARTDLAEMRGLRLDGTIIPLEAAGHQVQYGGRVADQSIIRDISARKAAEEALDAQRLARPLVRRIIQTLLQHVSVPRQATADLGRRLASAEFRDVNEALRAYRAMGLGSLRLERSDDRRYEFTGDDLIERANGSSQPTCHLSLSYLEGAVSATHQQPTLGTELLCQSQGHPQCRFVVAVKSADAAAPGKGGIGRWL